MSHEFEIVASKIDVLQAFVDQLRLAANPYCKNLADAVERVLKSASMDEIEKAFEMCQSQYGV